MSYDINLCYPGTTEVIQLSEKHQLLGGTYQLGGSWNASLNITYNYSPIFYRILGEKGIRVIYGLTGEESMPILKKAIAELSGDTDVNYWKPTEGNAKAALKNLVSLAIIHPKGIWSGD